MTIAIIGNQPFALARFRTLLIRDLVGRGDEVYAYCPGWSDDPESRAIVEAAGATTENIRMPRSLANPLDEVASVWSIRRALDELNPDAILTYFVKPVVYTALATLGLPIPRKVAMIEGLGITGGNVGALRARVSLALHQFAASRYDAIFVLNPDDESFYLDEVGVDERRLRRIEGIGIDLSEFEVGPSPPGPATFLFVARMLRQKGVWEFVEAARLVRAAYPDARFVMLGSVDDSRDAVDEARLRMQTAEAGVEWKGHVNNVRDYLADASVFVLPSYYREGYPRSIMEAMAAGRAVITTDNPGCREAVVDGESGLIVPPRDVAALAEAMKEMIEDPARTAEMGRVGRELAVERYDHAKINARVIKVLVGEESPTGAVG